MTTRMQVVAPDGKPLDAGRICFCSMHCQNHCEPACCSGWCHCRCHEDEYREWWNNKTGGRGVPDSALVEVED